MWVPHPHLGQRVFCPEQWQCTQWPCIWQIQVHRWLVNCGTNLSCRYAIRIQVWIPYTIWYCYRPALYTHKNIHYIDSIFYCTRQNLIKLNVANSNNIIFSRPKDTFTTRFHINKENLKRKQVTELLGVNKSFVKHSLDTRLILITRLQYFWHPARWPDWVDFCSFIRSVDEHCSVSFHSSVTQE